MPKSKKEKWLELLLVAGGFIAVFLISITHFGENAGIKVYADELGYWRNAALLTGRDWSNEASSSAYYGFGYGFLLSPIFHFWNEEPETMMRAAIIMQGLMLSSCYAAAWLILRKLEIIMCLGIRAVILFYSVLYTANIFMVKFTMSETVLTTCVWWSAYLALCYIKEKKICQAAGLAFISIYMFSVHQRMLTVVLVHFLLIFIIETSNQNKKRIRFITKMLFYIFLFAGLLFLFRAYDNYYTFSLYSQAADAGRGANRVDSGIMSRIPLFLSLEGISKLIRSLCGKLFYSIVATYGGIFFGIIAIVQNVVREYKSRGKLENCIWGVYLLLNFLGAMGVSMLAMCDGFETRNDLLMYGRYTEFTYGPILLTGAISLFQDKRLHSRNFLLMIMLLLALCFVCVDNTYNIAPNSNFWVNCSALSDLVCKDNNITNQDIIMIAAMRSVGILGTFFAAACFTERYRTKISEGLLIFITMTWIYTANVNWEKNVMPWYEPMRDSMKDITVELENEESIIVFDVKLGGCLQFQLPNVALKICQNIEEIEEYETTGYVITDVDSTYAEYIREHYTIVKENEKYMRWIMK